MYGIKKSRDAFTLLELLLAITIFSIIATALYSSFYSGLKILKRSEEAMKLHQDLRFVTEELSLELRNALITPLQTEENALTQELEEEKVYYFRGDRKGFRFVSLKNEGVCELGYRFKGDQANTFLRTARFQSHGFTSQPERDEELLVGILEDVEVLYSYEGQDEDAPIVWLDIWEIEEMLPLGIKVRLRLKGLGDHSELTKTVYLPVGELGKQGELE